MKLIDNIWEDMEKEYFSHPEYFGNPVKETSIINEAQKILGANFPQSYITFLTKFGGMIGDGHIVFGLLPSDKTNYLKTNIIEKTKFYKEVQKWPGIDDWYIVSDDGSGNPIGIDPEGKVWLSDHDADFEKVKLADNFEEFLYKLHTDTLYE